MKRIRIVVVIVAAIASPYLHPSAVGAQTGYCDIDCNQSVPCDYACMYAGSFTTCGDLYGGGGSGMCSDDGGGSEPSGCYQWADVDVQSDSQCQELYSDNITALWNEYQATASACVNAYGWPEQCMAQCEAGGMFSFDCDEECQAIPESCYNDATAAYNYESLMLGLDANDCEDACPD
jgi:hypothetical protein